MKVQLLKLDRDQIFVLGGRLWIVEEVVTNASDIIQHLNCRPFTTSRRGTSTISSAFVMNAPIVQLQPDNVVAILDVQELHEVERH